MKIISKHRKTKQTKGIGDAWGVVLAL